MVSKLSKIGDIVIAIDATVVSIRSLADVRRSFEMAPVGRPIAIAYSRVGTPATVQVVRRDLIPR
jgi:hypothetical protein